MARVGGSQVGLRKHPREYIRYTDERAFLTGTGHTFVSQRPWALMPNSCVFKSPAEVPVLTVGAKSSKRVSYETRETEEGQPKEDPCDTLHLGFHPRKPWFPWESLRVYRQGSHVGRFAF